MKGPSRPLRQALGLSWEAAAFFSVAAFAFGLSYVLGNGILLGPIQGNDSPLHIGYATWLNEYYPSIPHWYPLQGSGISLVHGYPVLSHLLLVVLHRLTGGSIQQVFRLVSFLSFPATALGIYLFCRLVLGNRTVGFIASVLYLLAPISWTWMYDWGFFPQQVASVFVPFTLAAFDQTWKAMSLQEKGGARRIWFAVLAALVSVVTLTHLLVGFSAIAFMLMYVVFLSGLAQKGRRRVLVSGLRVIFLLGVIVGLIAAAYLVPFYTYGKYANRDGLNDPSVDQLHRLSISHFLGIEPIDEFEILTRMQFPAVVSLLAALGLFASIAHLRFGLDRTKGPAALALSTAFSVVFALTPMLPALVLGISSTLFFFLNFRSMLIVAMVLVPVLAAFGVVSTFEAVVFPERLLRTRPAAQTPRRHAGFLIRSPVATLFSIGATFSAVFLMGNAFQPGASHLPYGPVTHGVELADIWQTGVKTGPESQLEQIAFANWPPFSVRDEDPLTNRSRRLAAKIERDRQTRIDISPYDGRLAMDLVSFADVSQIHTYTYTASLFQAMWGYQRKVYFSKETPVTEYGTATSLKNAAYWFGTEYVFLDENQDDLSMYEEAGWKLKFQESATQLWENPDPPELAEVARQPVVLVISRPDSDGYMTLFRMANDGLLPFTDAILVEGEPNIDSYSVQDLAPFDGLILYGYDYRDSRDAWEILAEYVAGGGSLFVDTGWEFWVPEWEFARAPDILPIEKLTWTDYGPNPQYQLGSESIVGTLDTRQFKPLAWEGGPWAVSGAEYGDLREWGEVVLSAGGRPLIVAGRFGEGKVVWSGMNLIAHAQYQGTSGPELQLVHNLIGWLVELGESEDTSSVLLRRDHPDHVRLATAGLPPEKTWLLWREVYYPNWQAEISDSEGFRELPIFRAGPGYMLMPLEATDGVATVALDWRASTLDSLGVAGSLFGIIVLLAHVLDGLLLGGNGLTWVRIAVLTRIPRPFLGEGSNREWAERKRRELESGGLDHGPRVYAPSEAIPWLSQDKPASPDPVGVNPNGQHNVGISATEEHEELLESWLDSTGHRDDAWAQKLLGKKQQSQGS